ncbi:MAG: Hsp70 family protein, partial [Myxococcota bacterium]
LPSPAGPPMQLGVDFGTTRTVVAARDRGNFPIVAFETADGSMAEHWPTVVATNGKKLVYGWEAMAHVGDRRWTVVRSLKRLLPSGNVDQPVSVGRFEIPLGELLIGFLRALRRDLAERSTAPPPPDEPLEAWVAVPAGATSGQRFLTLEAFRGAGFDVKGILNEPSAAGLEYAHRYRKSFTAARDDVLVYDLGGGTFDVSLVRMADLDHLVTAHAGDNHLGGEDFDQILAEMVVESLGRTLSDLGTGERVRLLEQCRTHKERLNPNTRKIVVDLEDGPSVTVGCAEYYDRCLPLVERSLDAIGRVLAPGSGATDEDRFALESLAGVYVVGGASDLPVVARRLREVFGRRVKRSAYASGATAVGLAIAFDEQAPRISDRFSRTFGVFREAESGAAIAFDPILAPDVVVRPEGTELVRRYQSAHNLGCYRFAECDRLERGVPVGDLHPWSVVRFAFDPGLRALDDLATVEVRRVDHPRPWVEERYHIDPNGVVEVRITDLDTGFSQSHQLSGPRA